MYNNKRVIVPKRVVGKYPDYLPIKINNQLLM